MSEFDPRGVRDEPTLASNQNTVAERNAGWRPMYTVFAVLGVLLVVGFLARGSMWGPSTASDPQTRAATTIPADRSAGNPTGNATTGMNSGTTGSGSTSSTVDQPNRSTTQVPGTTR